MALELDGVPYNDVTTKILKIKDETGTYDVTDNAGGYGAPNAARNTLALFLYALDKSGSEDVALSVTSYDEETVTEFSIQLASLDYHIRAYLFAVAIETGGESEGDIYYNTSADEIREKTAGGYDVLTIADLVSRDVTKQQLDIPVMNFSLDALRNKAQAQMMRAVATPNDQYTPQEAIAHYRHVDDQVLIATIAFQEKNYGFYLNILSGLKRYIEENLS